MDEQLVVGVNGYGEGLGERQRPLPIPEQIGGTNGHPIRQPTLFTNGENKANGKPAQTHLNGQTKGDDKPAKLDTSTPSEPSAPPVPRPRLLLAELSG
jgi:hypothetical protein